MIHSYLVIADNNDEITKWENGKIILGQRKTVEKVFFLLPPCGGVKCAANQYNHKQSAVNIVCIFPSLVKTFSFKISSLLRMCATPCVKLRCSTLFELSFLSDEFSSWNFHQFMRKKEKKLFTLNFSWKTRRKTFFIALKLLKKLLSLRYGKNAQSRIQIHSQEFFSFRIFTVQEAGKIVQKRRSSLGEKSQLRENAEDNAHEEKLGESFIHVKASECVWKFTSLKWNLFIHFSFFCFHRWTRKTLWQVLWNWFQRLSINFVKTNAVKNFHREIPFLENVCN